MTQLSPTRLGPVVRRRALARRIALARHETHRILARLRRSR